MCGAGGVCGRGARAIFPARIFYYLSHSSEDLSAAKLHSLSARTHPHTTRDEKEGRGRRWVRSITAPHVDQTGRASCEPTATSLNMRTRDPSESLYAEGDQDRTASDLAFPLSSRTLDTIEPNGCTRTRARLRAARLAIPYAQRAPAALVASSLPHRSSGIAHQALRGSATCTLYRSSGLERLGDLHPLSLIRP